MKPEEIKKVLNLHTLWIQNNVGGIRANLQNADLRSAYLQGANLQGADLRSANLQNANLQNADLHNAYLRGANLQNADLRSAYLQGANLQGANLHSADLRSAYLHSADLRSAYLPAPTMMLLAYWGQCSKELTQDLMRFDASDHPNPEAFDIWASGGPCPYNNTKIQRSANFVECREDYAPGPAPSAYQLMIRLIAEHCKNAD